MLKKIFFLILAVLVWEGCKHAINSKVLTATNKNKYEYRIFTAFGDSESEMYKQMEVFVNDNVCKPGTVSIIETGKKGDSKPTYFARVGCFSSKKIP